MNILIRKMVEAIELVQEDNYRKDIGGMVHLMEKEELFFQVEIIMKENIKMIRRMDMVRM